MSLAGEFCGQINALKTTLVTEVKMDWGLVTRKAGDHLRSY